MLLQLFGQSRKKVMSQFLLVAEILVHWLNNQRLFRFRRVSKHFPKVVASKTGDLLHSPVKLTGAQKATFQKFGIELISMVLRQRFSLAMIVARLNVRNEHSPA